MNKPIEVPFLIVNLTALFFMWPMLVLLVLVEELMDCIYTIHHPYARRSGFLDRFNEDGHCERE